MVAWPLKAVLLFGETIQESEIFASGIKIYCPVFAWCTLNYLPFGIGHHSIPTRKQKDSRWGRYNNVPYSIPRSANDILWSADTMRWSNTRTSTKANASFKRRVIISSAALGSATPEQ